MQFSEKRASSRIMNMLATARDHAVRYKRLTESKLVVGMYKKNGGSYPLMYLHRRSMGNKGTQAVEQTGASGAWALGDPGPA